MPIFINQDPTLMIDILLIDTIVDDSTTFIKMHIEGSELSFLKGARKTIESLKPKMALSAYHRDTDLLELTDYVLSINSEYTLGLRHHTP